MPVIVNLQRTGLLNPATFDAWTREKREQIRVATRSAFRSEAKPIVASVHSNVKTALKLKQQKLLKSYKVRHFDSKPESMPSMLIGSSLGIATIHETGGTIKPKGKLLLIPIGAKRVGRKTFKQYIANLIASKNAFFKKMPNGTVVVFAKNVKADDATLRTFKRAERQLSGKQLKRGALIPVAIAVPNVTLFRRTNVRASILKSLPKLANAVVTAIGRKS